MVHALLGSIGEGILNQLASLFASQAPEGDGKLRGLSLQKFIEELSTGRVGGGLALIDADDIQRAVLLPVDPARSPRKGSLKQSDEVAAAAKVVKEAGGSWRPRLRGRASGSSTRRSGWRG